MLDKDKLLAAYLAIVEQRAHEKTKAWFANEALKAAQRYLKASDD